jgi:putative copper export protein
MESFDAIAVALRAMAFIAALQAAGLALFVAAHRRALGNHLPPFDSLARAMTLAGLALVLGHQAFEATRLAGDWSGMLEMDIQSGNWHRSAGVAALAGAVALALEYAGWCIKGRRGRWLTLLGAFGAAASFTLTGHTTARTVSPLIRLLLFGHVAIVGYWLGSVVALLRLTKVATTQALEQASTRFSESAVWIVPAILPIGVAIAVGLLPNLAALHTVYGALLASKLTGFAILLILASFNRWRVVPALEREPLAATGRFRRMLQAEYLLLSAVISVTTVMTSLYSWH